MGGRGSYLFSRRTVGAVLVLAALATTAFLTRVTESRSADDIGGAYYVVDGPRAGTLIFADAGGRVDEGGGFERIEVKGRVAPPGKGCKELHFKGLIGGHRTEKNCWRVVPKRRASPLLVDICTAVLNEQGAEQSLKAHPVGVAYSAKLLSETFDDLQKAGKAGDIGEQKLESLEHHVTRAHKLDEEAEAAFKDGDRNKGREKLRDALEQKYEFVNALPRDVFFVKPPDMKAIDATFVPAQKQTVYTEKAKDPDGRDLRFHWTLVEHNDPTCINFEPNEPHNNQAIWHHGDDQGCNHGLEGPKGHVGTITVVVRDGKFQCAAFYNGSQGASGNPEGTGPDPGPCHLLGED